jgi:endoglucanase
MTLVRYLGRKLGWRGFAGGVATLLGALTLAASGPALAQEDPIHKVLDAGFTPIDAFAQARRMGRGVNILGYDPIWNSPAQARFQTRHFARIHEAGFGNVRVNLEAFSHMDAQGRLDPAWLKILDWVVANALANRLTVIIDEHNFEECGQDLDACRPKLTAFWRQIAERYRNAPNPVVFELLNEPNGKITDERWNKLSAELLALVRKTNPERTVIIGPEHYNGLEALPALNLPEGDRNIIVTVHYYHPMRFTHQGAAWAKEFTHLSGVTWGSPEDYQLILKEFDTVQDWAHSHNRPIFLGEFGAYDRGEMPSRVRYSAAVARAAEARGWPWAYWQFDSNFVVYDIDHDAWVAPILNALIPEHAAQAAR